MKSLVLALFWLPCAHGLAAAAQEAPSSSSWPSFRGHRASGVADEASIPISWSVPDDDNIAWRTPIPGLGHSSPVVWGERLFVTTAVRVAQEAELGSLYGSPNYGAGESVEDEGINRFEAICLDRDTGEILWQRTAHEGVPATKRHPKSSHANPTPACDAERVVAFFGSEGLYAFDHEGELLWKRDFGVLDAGAPGHPKPEDYQWGFASSPVLHEGRVYVQCDVQGQSFVAALDAATGEDVWRRERDEDPTWCTPTVLEHGAGGRAQLVLNGYKHIGGYDLENGEEVWKLSGGGDVPVPTPVVAHGQIYLTSAHGRMRPVHAIAVEAEGTVTMDVGGEGNEHLTWSHRNKGIYMQTPLVYGDELYCCADGGVLTVFDAHSGEELYRERLNDGTSGFSGSAVAAAGKVFFTAESGEVIVLRAGREFQVMTVNDLGETCMSTPAIAGGRLFFRTRGAVVAVGA